MTENQFDDYVPFWRNEAKQLVALLVLVLILVVFL